MLFATSVLLFFFCAVVALCLVGAVVGVVAGGSASVIIGIRELKQKLLLQYKLGAAKPGRIKLPVR
jgi:hypothetical protein